MGSILGQYSFVLVLLVIFIVAAFILLRRQLRWQEFLSLGVIGLGLVTAWIVLHPVQTPLMEDSARVREMIGQGKPVLLEFQSPY